MHISVPVTLPLEAGLQQWNPGITVFETLICVLAAVPSQGEPGGRKPSPAEPDPAAEPAEPDAARAEHGE